MRGHFLHNKVLLVPLAELALSLGAQVTQERYLALSGVTGYVDLVIRKGDILIACEAENTPDRVGRDVRKAIALEADVLVIVVPTTRVATASRNQVRKHFGESIEKMLNIYVCTLTQAIQRVKELMTFKVNLECPDDIKTSNPMEDDSSIGDRTERR